MLSQVNLYLVDVFVAAAIFLSSYAFFGPL